MLSSSEDVKMLPSSSSKGSRQSVGSEGPEPVDTDTDESEPVATRGAASTEAETSTICVGGGAKAASTAAAGDIIQGVGHLTTGGLVSDRGAIEPEVVMSTGSLSKTWTHELDEGCRDTLSTPDSPLLAPPSRVVNKSSELALEGRIGCIRARSTRVSKADGGHAGVAPLSTATRIGVPPWAVSYTHLTLPTNREV